MNNNQKIIVTAMGLPVKKGPKFLLSRRHAPKVKAWHNKWQVAGGALEFGESPEEAMIRELQEELGVIPKILYPQPIVKTSIWYGHETSRNHDAQIILITYLVDIGSQLIDILKEKETNKVGWFTRNQIKKLNYLPLTMEIVNEAFVMINKNLINNNSPEFS